MNLWSQSQSVTTSLVTVATSLVTVATTSYTISNFPNMLQGFFYEAKEKKLFLSPELGLSDELTLNQHLNSINSPAPLYFENLDLFLPNLFSRIIFDVTMLTDDPFMRQIAS